jgi:hypothetical protein
MKIIFRPLLASGIFGEQSGVEDEIRQEIEALAARGVRPVILIASNQPDEDKLIGLWHEILHMVIFARDPEAPQDEEWVEASARKLAAAVPDLLDKMGDTNG